MIAAGVIAVALVTGCGGAQSTDDIARGLDEAINATEAASAARTAAARAKARSAACTALKVYSSDPAQTLPDLLEQQAAAQKFRSDFGLTEVDPAVPQRLIDAADEIDGTQQAGDVLSKVC